MTSRARVLIGATIALGSSAMRVGGTPSGSPGAVVRSQSVVRAHGDSSEFLAVIPARFAAQRFPGKPLAILWGKPLLQHVWERARDVPSIDDLVIATDDARIASAASAWGASVAMTS